MATLTIRNLDDEVKRALRRRAADHGVSMEQEVRTILREVALGSAPKPIEPGAWRLKATKEEILSLGRRLPADDFDLKKVSDELYDYLYEQK
jgi:antitoxin FitA